MVTNRTLDLAISTAAVTEETALPKRDEAALGSIHPPVQLPQPPEAESFESSSSSAASGVCFEGSDSTFGDSCCSFVSLSLLKHVYKTIIITIFETFGQNKSKSGIKNHGRNLGDIVDT